MGNDTPDQALFYCYLLNGGNPFPLQISLSDTIGELKEQIKAKKRHLSGIDADELSLWVVKLPQDEGDGYRQEAQKLTSKVPKITKDTSRISEHLLNKHEDGFIDILAAAPNDATPLHHQVTSSTYPKRTEEQI
ncbi:hypothetical protein M422DRAFT_261460 [Sphaerobolus stellatus SS14]|uniref:Crinkler effector protein N-terminal domain-containing protein n=1 Tax=Sphaerobolus stellatus (strain SS14) TaxID=990650 RepID=A0A0C9UMQ7_SPHS4|nr:hypothetical protein M422DRAFT_261460 [Sphaerobolus stellatus SS14]